MTTKNSEPFRLLDTGHEEALAKLTLHKTQLLEFQRLMILAAELDLALKSLHSQGRIGFHVSSQGLEALSIGAASALAPKDWIFPNWQFSAVTLARDVALESIFDNAFGNARDLAKGHQGPKSMGFFNEKIIPSSAPVGTQIAQAVGCAQAAKIRGNQDVVLTCFGADARESGDFHTGLNFAGVLESPVVFLAVGHEEISETAAAYGLDALLVDADDILAVYDVTRRAVERARQDHQPTLIDARVGDGSGLSRLARYLETAGLSTNEMATAFAEEARHEIRLALENSSNIGFPAEATLFNDVLSAKSQALNEQEEAMNRFGAEYGGAEDPDADLIYGD